MSLHKYFEACHEIVSHACLQQFYLDINFTYNETYQSFFSQWWHFLSEAQLLSNVLLISALQQSDSIIHMYVYIYIVCVCVCIYTLIFFFFLATLSSMWDLSSDQGLNLHPLQWKCGVLTNGLPETSIYIFSIMIYIRILNIVLCALQQELVHPFHIL